MSGLFGILALVCLLVAVIGQIRILVAAFQDSVVTGLLSLCVPLYIFYFAFAAWEDEGKMKWIGIWLGGVVAYGICLGLAIATAGPMEIPG